MLCVSQAYCPQCEQIIHDPICICAGVCVRHGPVCTQCTPDGIYSHRYNGRSETTGQLSEYRNGWCVGETIKGEWVRREPGHPTKSAQDVWREEFIEQNARQQVEMTEWRRVRDIEQRDQLNCNGGGGI